MAPATRNARRRQVALACTTSRESTGSSASPVACPYYLRPCSGCHTSAKMSEGRMDDVLETPGSGSQRGRRGMTVDSPSPKKKRKTYADHQFKWLVDSLTESVKMKSSSSKSNRRGEIHFLMKTLAADGLSNTSPMYYFAVNRLKDPVNRDVLIGFKRSDQRLGWVQHCWDEHHK